MLVPEIIKEKIESIRKDRERGASELVIQVIEVFKDFITFHPNPKREEMEEFVKEISYLRPSMFPISNHARKLGRMLMSIKTRDDGMKAISGYLNGIKERDERIMENASFLKNFSIITCSYSSLLGRFLKGFINELKSVMVCKSRIGDISYGEKYLSIGHSKIILIPDEEMENFSNVDCGIIGADGITSDGYIINGKPSLRMCSFLKLLNKSLWVITGLDKFGEKLETIEEGFDLVPENLITGFITEFGIMKFEEFCSSAKSYFG